MLVVSFGTDFSRFFAHQAKHVLMDKHFRTLAAVLFVFFNSVGVTANVIPISEVGDLWVSEGSSFRFQATPTQGFYSGPECGSSCVVSSLNYNATSISFVVANTRFSFARNGYLAVGTVVTENNSTVQTSMKRAPEYWIGYIPFINAVFFLNIFADNTTSTTIGILYSSGSCRASSRRWCAGVALVSQSVLSGWTTAYNGASVQLTTYNSTTIEGSITSANGMVSPLSATKFSYCEAEQCQFQEIWTGSIPLINTVFHLSLMPNASGGVTVKYSSSSCRATGINWCSTQPMLTAGELSGWVTTYNQAQFSISFANLTSASGFALLGPMTAPLTMSFTAYLSDVQFAPFLPTNAPTSVGGTNSTTAVASVNVSRTVSGGFTSTAPAFAWLTMLVFVVTFLI